MLFTAVLLATTNAMAGLPPQLHATPVLMSGSSAEVFGSGLTFGLLGGAQINESGEVLVYSLLEGPGVTDANSRVVMLVDDANTLPILREGQASPFGDAAETVYQIGEARLSNDSTVYLDAKINRLDPPSHPTVFWKYQDGGIAQLLSVGDPVGESDLIVSTIGTAQVSSNNGAITSGFLTGMEPGFVDGMFGERNDVVQMFQPNGRLPGLPSRVTYAGPLGRPGMSPSGALAYAVAVEGPGVTEHNRLVMYAERDGAMQIALRSGAPSPDAGPNLRIDWFDSLAFNEARQLTFRGRLAGPGVNGSNENAIWFNDADATRLVMRNGDPAPGFGDLDVTFSYVGAPALDADGGVVFFAQMHLGGDVKEGIFSWNAMDGLRKLVSSIEPVPGVNDEMFFRTMGVPVVNGAGKVAFFGEACWQSDCGYGIWAQDAQDRFRVVAIEGQEFRVGLGDWRVVSDVDWSASGAYEVATGNESGDRIVLLDDGTLTFSADFQDGTSGVFTIDTNAVPEPSSWLILLGALACLGVARVQIKYNAGRRRPM